VTQYSLGPLYSNKKFRLSQLHYLYHVLTYIPGRYRCRLDDIYKQQTDPGALGQCFATISSWHGDYNGPRRSTIDNKILHSAAPIDATAIDASCLHMNGYKGTFTRHYRPAKATSRASAWQSFKASLVSRKAQKRKIRKTKRPKNWVAQKKRSGKKSVKAVREEQVKLRGGG